LVSYRHTQFGWVLAFVVALCSAAAIVAAFVLPEGAMRAPWWTPLLLVALLGFGLVIFGWLTVEVDARDVRIRFGIGAFRKTIPVADVLRCERVRTRLRWGWGLRWTPAGWLYNVSGREAVRLESRRERPVVIGSDDADALKAAIDARMAVAAADRQAA
jgi:hypothetical protein